MERQTDRQKEKAEERKKEKDRKEKKEDEKRKKIEKRKKKEKEEKERRKKKKWSKEERRTVSEAHLKALAASVKGPLGNPQESIPAGIFPKAGGTLVWKAPCCPGW